MTSPYQTATRSKTYDTAEEKEIATKTDATLRSIARGIDDADRARVYVEAEVAVADADDRDPRKKLIGLFNRRAAELDDAESS